MLIVSELYIYPIKSLAGVKVDRAKLTDRGFKYDRRWMLIDDNNRFISQREVAAMALLKVEIESAGLKISSPDSFITIPFIPERNEFIKVTIWDDICSAQLVDETADKWFTSILGVSCRLVYMPDESHRKTDVNYTSDGGVTSLSDGYPFLLIGQASLDDLNERLPGQLTMERFRPNIVFKGGTPYQEDIMDEIIINGIVFNGVKLCARCKITTIDPASGIAGKEPLKTLAGYRAKNKKIYFGQNLVHSGIGEISVGDEIAVLSVHREERFLIQKN